MTPPTRRARADLEADLAAVLAYAVELYEFVVTELDRDPHPPAAYATSREALAGAAIVEASLPADLAARLEEEARPVVDTVDAAALLAYAVELYEARTVAGP